MQLVPSRAPGAFARRRLPRAGFEGGAGFARQIDASLRLAPAEAYRATTAVLLGCGRAVDLGRAADAVRDGCLVDVVHPLCLPVDSWSRAIEVDPGTESWLRHFVMREIRRIAPDCVAILAPQGDDCDAQNRSLPVLIGMLRGWGATAPIAALRMGANHEVEWLARPPGVFGATADGVIPARFGPTR